jgi:CRP/FNR family cyclic AMP-dependent transcriptional regulator
MSRSHLRRVHPAHDDSRKRGGTAAAHGHLDFIAAIPGEYRDSVLEQCTVKSYRKGEIVWSQGDAVNSLAFLAAGKVFSLFHGANGRSGAVNFWSSGDILGAELIAGEVNTRQTSLRCLEDATIYYLEWPKFDAIVRRFPEVAYAVITALSVRLRWAIRLVHILQTQTAFNRVGSVLLALAERFPVQTAGGTMIDLDITHEDLAAIVGVSRQFMTVTLHELEHQGLLSNTRKRITLTDLEKLRELTQAH